MRTIVAGSRGVMDIRQLHAALIECGWVPSVIISGGARGADRLGEEWAEQMGLQLMDSFTPIQPILVGDSAQAVRLSQQLRARGLLVTAIRPPTVPAGGARLRVTLSAAHTEAQVQLLLNALNDCWPTVESNHA